jgi:hypothetical protein
VLHVVRIRATKLFEGIESLFAARCEMHLYIVVDIATEKSENVHLYGLYA